MEPRELPSVGLRSNTFYYEWYLRQLLMNMALEYYLTMSGVVSQDQNVHDIPIVVDESKES